MKLKTILALILSIIAQAAMGEDQLQLKCSGGRNHTFFSLRKVGIHSHGTLVHNYSVASVICPQSAEALRTPGKMKCYGSWHWDSLINGEISNDSIAWVEITNSGQKITAIMQTSQVYYSVLKTMNCELK